MKKIKSIEVVNFKAIKDQKIELNGASAIVTGGNNKGKSSLLKGLIDRFRGEKPSIIVKEGEEKGFNRMELTDGSVIEWNFTDKTERLSFTTADEIKMTTGVISKIGEKFFGIKFDINKFIMSSKKEALKMVQKLVGLDLDEIDARYKKAYDERTYANRYLKEVSALNIPEPENKEKVDIEALKEQKQGIVTANENLKKEWLKKVEDHRKQVDSFNKEQQERKDRRKSFLSDWQIVEQFEDEDSHEITAFIDLEGISRFYDKMEAPLEKKIYDNIPEPKYQSLTEIDQKIEDGIKSNANEADKIKYERWVEDGKKARKAAEAKDKAVKEIEAEREKMIKNSKLPEGFSITDEGLTYNGFVIDDNQISSSMRYICALKLGSLGLGQVKAMHFDCSYLDKNSLSEIMEWAEKENLQLLLEKPSWEDEEIEYKIVQDMLK